MSKKHFNFKSSIRDWYIRAFPSDELGYRINTRSPPLPAP